jgi:hypothetical protein
MSSFFNSWTRLLISTIASTVSGPMNSSQLFLPSSSSVGETHDALRKQLKKEIFDELSAKFLQEIVTPIYTWPKIMDGTCFNSLENALMIIKLLRMIHPSFAASSSTTSEINPLIHTYFQQLEEISKISWNQNLFTEKNKHVIVIEGRSSVGKTAIIEQFLLREQYAPKNIKFEKIGYINYEGQSGTQQQQQQLGNCSSVHSVMIEAMKDMPVFVKLCFYFLETYRKCYEILSSEDDCNVFLVENYYHSFLVNSLLYNNDLDTNDEEYFKNYKITKTENLESLSSSSLFQWPIDLPMPELVSFFWFLFLLHSLFASFSLLCVGSLFYFID